MKLSDLDKINVVEKYIRGESSLKLAKEYKVTKQSILSILKIRGVKIRGKLGK